MNGPLAISFLIYDTILQINGANMSQIGFIRYDVPCIPLMLKTAFTLTFWVTLRQATYEYRVGKQSSMQSDKAAPVQAAKTDRKSKFIIMVGNVLNKIFLQLWIWVVVFVLFLCAIYGEKVTVFRIAYMTLVLVFLITFQVYINLINRSLVLLNFCKIH